MRHYKAVAGLSALRGPYGGFYSSFIDRQRIAMTSNYRWNRTVCCSYRPDHVVCFEIF